MYYLCYTVCSADQTVYPRQIRSLWSSCFSDCVLLQAILAAEPIYTGRPCLKTTLQTLLSISTTCRAPVHVTSQYVVCLTSTRILPLSTWPYALSRSSGSSVQPQPAAVHALNILRALYRDSRLADFVVPFISEGVIIAIQGFSASSWPVSGCIHHSMSKACE